MIVWRSKNKIMVLVLLLLLVAPALYLVRDSYISRLETITSHEDSSSQGRLMYWKAAVRMWRDHPMFGVGFGTANFETLLSSYLGKNDTHVAHNTYLQVLADSGIFAAILFTGLLLGTILWLNVAARRCRRERPELADYPYALQASLAAYAVGSIFLSRVTFDFYYMLLMMVASWSVIQKAMLGPASQHPTVVIDAQRIGGRPSGARRTAAKGAALLPAR
jgi:O-antigen ligase